MKAVIYRQFGSADVLEVADMPTPTPKEDQVLIRVAAAGVNPADWRFRNGQFKLFMGSRLPFIPGADIAGVVESVGSAVTRFKLGDRVYAMLPTLAGGGYAEYAVAAEKTVAHVPDRLSLCDAAAIPLTALTALQAMRDKAQLQPGQTILINGASGGVGSFGVQIAKAIGAHVTAVASARNFDFARGLGADAVRDYQHEDITASGQQYDVVFDAISNLKPGPVGRIVKRGGCFVTVNPALDKTPAALIARFSGWKVRSVFVDPRGSDLEVLNKWIESGQLKAAIDRTYPLEQVADAHRYSETMRVRGKLVLIVDEKLSANQM